jgi:mannose-1-phosphate guanylyltransferase
MQQLDPDSVMVSLHSDHFFADEEGFRQALLAAADVAKEGYLVTLGVKPDKPETGYGYIERGQAIDDFNSHETYQVNQFLEKPDLATAERFLAGGAYYWNSGIFIWQLSTLMDAFKTHMPNFRAKLDQMDKVLANGESINAIWETITPESIDVGIMERAEKVAVVPMDVGWNDVGSWAAIYEVYQANADGNVLIGDNCLTFDTTNSLVRSSDRLIATVGLDNIVIIDTGDALLICDKDKAQDVKKVINWLEENNRTELL